MSKGKYREFWINPNLGKNGVTPWKDNPVAYIKYDCYTLPGGFWPSKALHLIEHQAVVDLQAEVAELKRENQLLKSGLLKTEDGCIDPVWMAERIEQLEKENAELKDKTFKMLKHSSEDNAALLSKLKTQALVIEKLEAISKEAIQRIDCLPTCRSNSDSWLVKCTCGADKKQKELRQTLAECAELKKGL